MGVSGLRVEVCLFNDGFVSGKVGIADRKIDDIVVFCQRRGIERQAAAGVLKAVCDIISDIHNDASCVICGTTVAPLGMT